MYPHPPSLRNYLRLVGNDWHDCLERSFIFLRASWAEDWVGLPVLLDACLSFLTLSQLNASCEVANMLGAAKLLALEIESNANNPSVPEEPKYHNRLHAADVLTSMSIQIAIQSANKFPLNEAWVACALLAAIGHDFGHTGQVNRCESEIELNSIRLLRPILDNCKISSRWRLALETAILRSDFSIVHTNHKRVRGQDFGCNQEWLDVFLNEADVMASASAKFGPALGNALASEWKSTGSSAHHSVATSTGRVEFLNNLIFSSEPTEVLQMKKSVVVELNNLCVFTDLTGRDFNGTDNLIR